MFAFATAAAGAVLRASSHSASVCRPALSAMRPAARPAARSATVRMQVSAGTATSKPLVEGATVPSVVFKTRERIPAMEAAGEENPFDWVDKTSDDYFKGKRVVLFALPGAFTPTCSSTHVPGYEAAYDTIKGLGVDDVYCLSVNDAFVMYQWGLKQGVKNVKLVPDGACSFTRGMGMSCVWDTERGFGERSWRYSMVVKDGVIEKMFSEPNFVPNSGPDPFEVSDADTMVTYLKSVA